MASFKTEGIEAETHPENRLNRWGASLHYCTKANRFWPNRGDEVDVAEFGQAERR